MMSRLGETAARCRIATPEGFWSARGCPEGVTHKPKLVPLAMATNKSVPFPSSFSLLSFSLYLCPPFSSPGLDCQYPQSPSDLLWFVAKSHTKPPWRRPQRPNPLLRRTMCLHATITIGGTKRWTRSVDLRVYTRSPQNHT